MIYRIRVSPVKPEDIDCLDRSKAFPVEFDYRVEIGGDVPVSVEIELPNANGDILTAEGALDTVLGLFRAGRWLDQRRRRGDSPNAERPQTGRD